MPPPLVTDTGYASDWKAADGIITVTDSRWKGTGVQLLGTTNDGKYYTAQSVTKAALGYEKWAFINLRPKDANIVCEMYTPYIDLSKHPAIASTIGNSLGTWRNLEFMWNPVRQTYQTVLPLDATSYTIDIPTFAARFSVALAKSDFISWKFQKPCLLRLGTLPGVYETVSTSGSTDTYSYTLLPEHFIRYGSNSNIPIAGSDGVTTVSRFITGVIKNNMDLSFTANNVSNICKQSIVLHSVIAGTASSSTYVVNARSLSNVCATATGSIMPQDSWL